MYMNLTLYFLFDHFARKYAILKASGLTPPAIFNGREVIKHPIFTALIQ